jgi:hypothetical protein
MVDDKLFYFDLLIYHVDELNFQKIAKTVHNKRPVDLCVSPDAKQVAVCYENDKIVNFYCASDLVFIDSLNVASLCGGNVASAAWSSEMDFLYCCGTLTDEHGEDIIISVSENNECIKIPVHGSQKRKIIKTYGDRIVVWSSIGWWSFVGQREERFVSCAGYLRDNMNLYVFEISENGDEIVFDLSRSIENHYYFDLSWRIIGRRDKNNNLFPPNVDSIDIEGWKWGSAPTIGLREIVLDEDELSTSLAIAHDGSCFVLGTLLGCAALMHMASRFGLDIFQALFEV